MSSTILIWQSSPIRIASFKRPDGGYYNTGETFRQPELAETLKRIADNPDDFYHGAMAEKLAADMKGEAG